MYSPIPTCFVSLAVMSITIFASTFDSLVARNLGYTDDPVHVLPGDCPRVGSPVATRGLGHQLYGRQISDGYRLLRRGVEAVHLVRRFKDYGKTPSLKVQDLKDIADNLKQLLPDDVHAETDELERITKDFGEGGLYAQTKALVDKGMVHNEVWANGHWHNQRKTLQQLHDGRIPVYRAKGAHEQDIERFTRASEEFMKVYDGYYPKFMDYYRGKTRQAGKSGRSGPLLNTELRVYEKNAPGLPDRYRQKAGQKAGHSISGEKSEIGLKMDDTAETVSFAKSNLPDSDGSSPKAGQSSKVSKSSGSGKSTGSRSRLKRGFFN